MKNTNAKLSDLIEHFYSHFLLRDITYAFAGGVFIYALNYSITGNGYVPKQFSFFTLIYIFLSYFIGFAISEFAHLIHIVRKGHKFSKDFENKRPHLLLIQQDLILNYDITILNNHERTTYLMHIGAAIGVTAGFGSIIMLIFQSFSFIPNCWFHNQNFYHSFKYTFTESLLLIYALIMIYHSRWKSRQIGEEMEALYNNLKK